MPSKLPPLQKATDRLRAWAIKHRWALGLFACALLVRVGWTVVAKPPVLQYSDDARTYHDLATNLASGRGFVTTVDPPFRLDAPYARRPPLTPFLLGTGYAIFGPRLWVGQLLLAIVGSIAIAIVYELGCLLFSKRVALLGAAIAALYPFYVFLSAIPLTEDVAILLYALLGLSLVRDPRSELTKGSMLVGVVWGVAALNRPQIIGLAPFLAILAFRGRAKHWTDGVRWFATCVVCFTLVVGPWIIRDRIVMGGWIPISAQGGLELYAGNNEYTSTPLSALLHGARGWYEDPRMRTPLDGLSPIEANKVAFSLGVAFIWAHPGRALSYSAKKVIVFFRAYDELTARLAWYPVFVLSLFGFVWTRGRWRELLPLYLLVLQTVLTAALFTSMPRFRAPVEWIFILMAAYAIDRARTYYGRRFAMTDQTEAR